MLFMPCSVACPLGCRGWLLNMPGSFPSVQWVAGVYRAVVKISVDSAPGILLQRKHFGLLFLSPSPPPARIEGLRPGLRYSLIPENSRSLGFGCCRNAMGWISGRTSLKMLRPRDGRIRTTEKLFIEKQIPTQLSVLKSFPASPNRAAGLLRAQPPRGAPAGHWAAAMG